MTLNGALIENDGSALLIHPRDSVAVALRPLAPGTPIGIKNIVARDDIQTGHKIAVQLIKRGSPVLKYGEFIGLASADIEPGQHVHLHNLSMGPHRAELPGDLVSSVEEPAREGAVVEFKGIVRPDGRVGTRNYIGIIPTVACAGTVCRLIAGDVSKRYPELLQNVDGVAALTHEGGCAAPSSSGGGLDSLQRCLGGFLCHPNFGGVLLVGLGCEVNQYRFQLERAGLTQGPTVRAIGIQELGGTSRTVELGVQIVKEMLDNAGKVKRKVMPASEIVLGLECGGSDAFSGITANPALGVAVDLLVAHGGTAILSETTEIYGAEHLLARRARNPEVERKLLECVQWWEAFADRHGYEINNNPTPGNKAGGLTTILEKSLGAVAKAGTTTLNDVYQYAERVRERGFVFMNTPAYDLPSITAMVAGGATVVCFTTGCGSTVGCKPSPVIKIASNSPMYERMSEDMDINCGIIAEGRLSLKAMGEKIFRKIMAVASGEKTRSEIFDYGEVEFAPWQMGVML